MLDRTLTPDSERFQRFSCPCDISDRAQQFQSDPLEFMDAHIYPAEAVYDEQMRESGDPHLHPTILEELKAEARKRGLWNSFTRIPSGGRD